MPELKMSLVRFKRLCCFTKRKYRSVLGVGGKMLAAEAEAAGVASAGRDQGLLHVGHSHLQSAPKMEGNTFYFSRHYN